MIISLTFKHHLYFLLLMRNSLIFTCTPSTKLYTWYKAINTRFKWYYEHILWKTNHGISWHLSKTWQPGQRHPDICMMPDGTLEQICDQSKLEYVFILETVSGTNRSMNFSNVIPEQTCPFWMWLYCNKPAFLSPCWMLQTFVDRLQNTVWA